MCPYLCRPLKRCRVGQGVKTPPFHGGITGSNPVRGTRSLSLRGFFFFPPRRHEDTKFHKASFVYFSLINRPDDQIT